MRSLWLGLVVLLCTTAHAQESTLQMPASVVSKSVASEAAQIPTGDVQSIFLQLPRATQGIADVSYSTGSATTSRSGDFYFPESQRSNKTDMSTYSFSYLHGISDSLHLGVDAGFVRKSTSNSESPTSEGMRDFGVSLLRSNKSENGTFIYGLSAFLSPEPAANGNNRVKGSNFSGGHTFSPFVAMNSRLAQGIVGAKIVLNTMVRKTRYDDTGSIVTDSQPWSFDTTGFYEFPVQRLVTMGVALSLGSDHTVFNPTGARTYSGELYSGIKVLDDTLVRLSASGSSRDQATDNFSSTQLSVALRKTL